MSETQPELKRGHSRHDTALIHGLSSSEVQLLQDKCVEAKARAYCELGVLECYQWSS